MQDRDFKGIWIPKEVWFDTRLNALEKIVLFEVDSLDKEDGCFASNDYIAQFCQCSVWKVSTAIQKLIELGYIRIESFDGRHRTLRSNLVFSTRQPLENPKSAVGKSNAINTKEKNKNSNISSNDVFSQSFIDFWNIYPRHDAKQDAIKAWKALKPSDDLCATITTDIKRRLSDGGSWYKAERKYIPLPATYIRGKRWEDEPQGQTVAPAEAKEEPVHWSQLPFKERMRLQEEFDEREREEGILEKMWGK